MADKQSGPNDRTKRERPKSIDEALKVLDEALAGPSANLKTFVAEEVQSLNNVVQSAIAAVGSVQFGEKASKVSSTVTDVAGTLKTQVETSIRDFNDTIGKSVKEGIAQNFNAETAEKFAHQAADKLREVGKKISEDGTAFGREAYRKADQEVRANPWPYIGGLSVGAFALGLMFAKAGQRHEKASPAPASDAETNTDLDEVVNTDGPTSADEIQ